MAIFQFVYIYLEMLVGGWWLNHPSDKYALLVKLNHFLQVGVKIKSYLKPPPLNRCIEFCHMRLGVGEKTHATF